MPTTTQTPAPGASAPFPFSVGFPLVIRQSRDSVTICGANRGEGWPILCEVPRDTYHDKDAASIVRACAALVDGKPPLEAAAPELLEALKAALEDDALQQGRARRWHTTARNAIARATGGTP